MKTIELKVTGKVQGVFYRKSTRAKALKLDLAGWVKNENDDSVTILAQGPMDALQELKAWCHKGPEAAQVASVKTQEREAPEMQGFEIKHWARGLLYFCLMDANRLKKVEGQVQKDLAEIFRHLAQEKFQGVLFTVSSVRITADLSIAHVNLSLFPVKDKELIIDWCNAHKSLIKDKLVKRFEGKLRKMPELFFHLDEAIDAQAEIDKILKEGGDSPIKWK